MYIYSGFTQDVSEMHTSLHSTELQLILRITEQEMQFVNLFTFMAN